MNDRTKDVSSMKTTNGIAAMTNAGLLNGELTQDQINGLSLLIDLVTGTKKANQIGIDDIRAILEKQGMTE